LARQAFTPYVTSASTSKMTVKRFPAVAENPTILMERPLMLL
jgi:hypothetical protein